MLRGQPVAPKIAYRLLEKERVRGCVLCQHFDVAHFAAFLQVQSESGQASDLELHTEEVHAL